MIKLNKVEFTGFLGADFETRTLENGNVVATGNLAIDDSYKDKQGEWQNRTQWARLVLWGKTAEYALGKFRKGDHVYVEAKYTSREFEKDGVKRTIVEFVVSSIQATQKGVASTSNNNFPTPADEPANAGGDDLPF